MMCDACARGDHANCGMQTWCDCEDERDGDHESMPDLSEWDLYEEDGPMDLEDRLEVELDKHFPVGKKEPHGG